MARKLLRGLGRGEWIREAVMEGYIWINHCSYEGIIMEIDSRVKDSMLFFTLAQRMLNGNVTFVKAAAFGAIAAVVARKIQLGTHILVLGKLKSVDRQSRSTGKEYHGARIVVEHFRILGKEKEWREWMAAEFKEQNKTEMIKKKSIFSKTNL